MSVKFRYFLKLARGRSLLVYPVNHSRKRTRSAPHLVYVPYVHVDVGGAKYSYPQGPVDGPQRLGGRLSVHVRRCRGDASWVGRHDEVIWGQLGVQAVLGHQHQVRHPGQHDAATDVLGNKRQTETSGRIYRELKQNNHQDQSVGSYLVLAYGILFQ